MRPWQLRFREHDFNPEGFADMKDKKFLPNSCNDPYPAGVPMGRARTQKEANHE